MSAQAQKFLECPSNLSLKRSAEEHRGNGESEATSFRASSSAVSAESAE